MKTAELNATIRANTGAHNAKKLRHENKIPAVIYGESGTEHVEIDYIPMHKLISSPDLFLINLNANGNTKRVIIQETQYHPVTDRILHVDFLEAAVGRQAKLSIPVKLTGASKGVLAGGQLVLKTRHLKVKGVPLQLPEYIEVDITNLEIGKSIKVRDIVDFELLDPPNTVIVQVKTARKLEELVTEAPEGEAAEGEAPKEGSEGEESEEEKSE